MARLNRAMLVVSIALLPLGCSIQSRTAPPTPGSGLPATPPPAAIDAAIAQRLDRLRAQAIPPEVMGALRAFYNDRSDRPAWLTASGQPRAAAERLVTALSKAGQQGLTPTDYDAASLATRLSQLTNDRDGQDADRARLARLDVQLSRAFVRYASDLHQGLIRDPAIRAHWQDPPSSPDYAAALAQATHTGNVAAVLSGLAPPHAGYDRLVKALAEYRAIEAAGGWPQLPAGPVLKPGAEGPQVATLRKRLQLTSDLPPSEEPAIDPGHASPADAPKGSAFSTPAARYGHMLAAAVRHFQQRHGLTVDGRVGPSTRFALDVPAAARVREIEINLERWRWLPTQLGSRHVIVNIPAFELQAYNQDGPALDMKVIVGQATGNHATPLFSSHIRYLIFRPFWNVPYSIARKEVLAAARRNPSYLARHNFQIVNRFAPRAEPLPATPANLDAVAAGRLEIRQAPGAGNALGLVKFIFPNQYSVYLHDTPAAQLFSRAERDFSHGCVRVEKPVDLARFVLAGKAAWDRERILQAMHRDGRKQVDLKQPLPVYLVYFTAFVNDDGVQFRSDLYGHDAILNQAMRRADARRQARMASS